MYAAGIVVDILDTIPTPHNGYYMPGVAGHKYSVAAPTPSLGAEDLRGSLLMI